ncbi:MAG: CoA pyrophosphatase [Gemmatimonadetes bacterium]|nr:CoA pyrophosphatase [Gemmatimonadota bacterium]
MNPDLGQARENPDVSLPGRIRAALRDPPAIRLPDAECETRAAVTLLLAPDPVLDTDPTRSVDFEDHGVSGLFVIRAAWEGDPWSGHVALPGGRTESSDVDLVDTARREIREETDIRLSRDTFLGRLDEIHPRSAHLPSIGVTPYVAWLPSRPQISASHEIAGHIWVPLPDLSAPERRSTLTRAEPTPRILPTIEYAGEVIWGLTHAVIENFLARVVRVL